MIANKDFYLSPTEYLEWEEKQTEEDKEETQLN